MLNLSKFISHPSVLYFFIDFNPNDFESPHSMELSQLTQEKTDMLAGMIDSQIRDIRNTPTNYVNISEKRINDLEKQREKHRDELEFYIRHLKKDLKLQEYMLETFPYDLDSNLKEQLERGYEEKRKYFDQYFDELKQKRFKHSRRRITDIIIWMFFNKI